MGSKDSNTENEEKNGKRYTPKTILDKEKIKKIGNILNKTSEVILKKILSDRAKKIVVGVAAGVVGVNTIKSVINNKDDNFIKGLKDNVVSTVEISKNYIEDLKEIYDVDNIKIEEEVR